MHFPPDLSHDLHYNRPIEQVVEMIENKVMKKVNAILRLTLSFHVEALA